LGRETSGSTAHASNEPHGCPFCAIVARPVDHPVAWDDEHTLAFIDVRQPSEGHTLVVPKRHIRNLYDLDDETAGHLMRAVARVLRAVRDAFACEGMSHWISTDPAGGQEVFHLHVHIMPRRAGDGLLRKYPAAPPRASDAERERQAGAIRAALPPSP
jgi:histidine triad (HIT) family protein